MPRRMTPLSRNVKVSTAGAPRERVTASTSAGGRALGASDGALSAAAATDAETDSSRWSILTRRGRGTPTCAKARR